MPADFCPLTPPGRIKGASRSPSDAPRRSRRGRANICSSCTTIPSSSHRRDYATLIAEVGASQIVFGTDYPFPWTKTAVDHILDTPGLSDAERVAMLGETAEKLLSIKPA